MSDVELVRHQYDYDPETGEFLWRNPPFKAALSKATPGTPAGSIDIRDGTRHLKLGTKLCRASRLAWLYVHGEWPQTQVLYRDPQLPIPARDRLSNLRLTSEKEDLTPDRLRSLLSYDQETGEFRWRMPRKGVKAGAVASGLKNTSAQSANLYIRVDGVDYPAQRLAWFYVHGQWPGSRVAFADGNARNCSISNLSESGFEHGTRATPTISEEDRRTRQAATFRRHDLKRRFDLTAEEYQTKHDAQDGKCAVCGTAETATRGGKIKWLAVDHNHETGALRDLLCAGCNMMIGMSQEDPARLRAAAAYLERHAAEDDERAA